jgi:hypothetical protein
MEFWKSELLFFEQAIVQSTTVSIIEAFVVSESGGLDVSLAAQPDCRKVTIINYSTTA